MTHQNELKEILHKEIRNTYGEGLLYRLCNQYFIHYFRQSEATQLKLSQLVKKYNQTTISNLPGISLYDDEYVHVSLGHSIDHKNLHPMLENGGDVYPVDQEIGQICEDSEYCSFEGCCRTTELWTNDGKEVDYILQNKYHSIIFYCWLGINWMQMEGYKSGVVVKTSENNSLASFYLNDFQFDSRSKFDGEQNWQDAIAKYNRTSIGVEELFRHVKKEFEG